MISEIIIEPGIKEATDDGTAVKPMDNPRFLGLAPPMNQNKGRRDGHADQCAKDDNELRAFFQWRRIGFYGVTGAEGGVESSYRRLAPSTSSEPFGPIFSQRMRADLGNSTFSGGTL